MMSNSYLTANQARIFTAVILTGILSIGSGLTLMKNATASPVELSETTNEVLKQNTRDKRLPRPVSNAVLEDLARRERISTQELRIIDYSQQTWRNGCLELPQPDEICTQALVPGWRVVVSNGRQRWVYHTNNNGRFLRLASANTSTSQLPTSVRNAVLRAASQRLQRPVSQLKIVQAQQQTWSDGCLQLAQAGEFCSQALVPGWRVVVRAGSQTLVYHTNQTGSAVRLNVKAEENTDSQLPQRVRVAVLQTASEVSGLPIRALNIIKFRETGIVSGCDRPTFPYACDQIIRQSWQVTVAAGDKRWDFISNETGSQVQLTNTYNPTNNANLPKYIADLVLADASQRAKSKIAVSPKNIVQAQQVVWSNGCLDLGNGPCTFAQVPGWRVTVAIASERFVYHTDNNSLVKFNPTASNMIGDAGTWQPITIPANELPPPLDRDMVFREISSGGFAGRTYETVLLNDGRLIRVRIGDANDSERSVRRISRQQVRQFEKLLRKKDFGDFKNLSYPAPSGAADYITYTLTNEEGTVQYNDISQNSLPKNLNSVVEAWNQIKTSAQ